MADYLVGKSGGGKDRYKVGWNESKESSNAYRVGSGAKSPTQASNSELGGGDQGSPTGEKSSFKYQSGDSKNIGDANDNSNFGGSVSSGAGERRVAGGGEIELSYSEKGSFGEEKGAMARRKARMDGYRQAMSGGDGYSSPTVDLVNIKKG